MQTRKITILLCLAVILMMAAMISGPSPTQAAAADLFISEYIEGSSNNKAIEIYNGTGTAVNLGTGGYNIKIYFNGSTSAGTTINLTGTIADGDVFVVAHSSAAAAILAEADLTSGSSFFNGDDAVVLSSSGGVVDAIGQVGFDPGSQWGSGTVSTQDNTLRRQTAVCAGDTVETDAFDPSAEWDGFATDTFDGLGTHTASCGGGGATPTPSATATTPAGNSCGDPATLIHTIQGSGLQSGMNGSTGVTIEAVVVSDFQETGLNGFHVQEEDGDTDANAVTSEGIFVYEGASTVAVSAGDVVRITGDVAEYETSAGSGAFLTQMTNLTAVTVCSSGASVTPATVSFPVSSLDDWEAYESMLVNIPQTLTVSGNYTLGRYGSVDLSNGRLFQPTNIVAPGAAAATQLDINNRNRIILDDGDTVQNSDPVLYPAPGGLSASNTLRSGDTVTGLTAVLEQRFSNYQLQPAGTINFTHTNARTAAPSAVGGTLKVASFNVLNYFNGNGSGGGFPTARGATTAQEFTRQRDKIIAAMVAIDADVYGLMEIENDGYGSNSAIQDLVNGLNDATAPGTFTFIDPGVSVIGTDQIAVGLIYKVNSVSPVGSATILDSSVDSNFDDTKNRPMLTQTFSETATGEKFTVAVNHLKSKGSACDALGDPDTGDGQGNCNLTRTAAANAIVNYLATDPTNSNDPDFLIIGDLNSYALEDPIVAIQNGGYTNLISHFGGASAYSYVFSGQSGYLDHALANSSLLSQVAGVTEWHINADEPISLDYNTEFKSAGQINSFYSPDAYRASDHDPVMIGLALGGTPPTATPTSPPTATNTPIPPTATNTPLPTATNTPLPTATNTPIPPTVTNTPLPTATNTAVPPTATSTPSAGAPVIYVSSAGGGSAGGVSFADEDILAYDTGSGTYSMFFDGSDVGMGGAGALDVDAFHILGDGSILLSIVSASTLPDVGSVDDSDILRFVPTSTGTNTAGTFEWYFDGSDVGLSANAEDIDAIYIMANGDIVVSTSGNFSVSGASGADEDLAVFSPSSLGANTSGSWSTYFDGSDVALTDSSEDLHGAWIDEAGNDLYLTARGNFAVTGVSGDAADIFTCNNLTSGTTTSCTSFSLFWDGSANGYSGEVLDGFQVQN